MSFYDIDLNTKKEISNVFTYDSVLWLKGLRAVLVVLKKGRARALRVLSSPRFERNIFYLIDIYITNTFYIMSFWNNFKYENFMNFFLFLLFCYIWYKIYVTSSRKEGICPPPPYMLLLVLYYIKFLSVYVSVSVSVSASVSVAVPICL